MAIVDVGDELPLYKQSCPKCGARYYEVGLTMNSEVFGPTIVKNGRVKTFNTNHSETELHCLACGHTWRYSDSDNNHGYENTCPINEYFQLKPKHKINADEPNSISAISINGNTADLATFKNATKLESFATTCCSDTPTIRITNTLRDTTEFKFSDIDSIEINTREVQILLKDNTIFTIKNSISDIDVINDVRIDYKK